MIPQPREAVHPDAADDSADDPRVLELAKEYQVEWETRGKPDRGRYLNRYPELAPILAAYLEGIDLLHRGAQALSGAGGPRPKLETGLTGGDRLGEFELIREIGRGGMGIVYEAKQTTLNRRVAVKVLPNAFANDRTRLQRFIVEAQAAASVAHPNIVPIYAIGEENGIPYYAMRLVDGFPLDVLAAKTSSGSREDRSNSTNEIGKLSTRDQSHTDHLLSLARQDRAAYHRAVASLGAQVARALDHAHQHGVVHRDIKPANLLLEKNGHIWVTDFGLAQLSESPTVTRSGAAIGTLRYMSPEQASGDRRRLDHRTDIYSLAVTLYELLTGRPAFPASGSAKLLQQITNEDPPTPRSIDPTIPVDVETVLLKGMQKDTRDRYLTAGELAEDLERCLAGVTVVARRPSLWDHLKNWAGKRPTAVAATMVSLLVIIVVSGIATARVASEHREAKRAHEEARQAYRESEEARLAAAALAKSERERADELERRYRRAKELAEQVLRISEDEIGSGSPFQGPRRQLLLMALDMYGDLIAAPGRDPNTVDELVKMRAKLKQLLEEQTTQREAEAVFLLAHASVRSELDLNADQTAKIDRIFRPSTPANGPGKGPPALIHIKAPPVLDAPIRLGLIQILDAKQRQRLRQIYLQTRGLNAFSEPDVVEAIRLTAEQRQQIRLLQTENQWFSPIAKTGISPRFNTLEFNTKTVERFIESFTAEQRDAWSRLTGKAFRPQKA
jgi:serine/threonine protein kinase